MCRYQRVRPKRCAIPMIRSASSTNAPAPNAGVGTVMPKMIGAAVRGEHHVRTSRAFRGEPEGQRLSAAGQDSRSRNGKFDRVRAGHARIEIHRPAADAGSCAECSARTGCQRHAGYGGGGAWSQRRLYAQIRAGKRSARQGDGAAGRSAVVRIDVGRVSVLGRNGRRKKRRQQRENRGKSLHGSPPRQASGSLHLGASRVQAVDCWIAVRTCTCARRLHRQKQKSAPKRAFFIPQTVDLTPRALPPPPP